MIDINYIKSWAGLLKIGQFFVLLIAFSTLADFSNKSENNGGFKFFLFVTVTSWLIVMILFGLFVTQLYERIPLNWTIAMIIYSVSEVLLLLISSSIVAEKSRQLRRGVKHPTGKHYIDTCDEYSVSCSNVEAAVVFGFIGVALFLADAVFYFMKHRAAAEGPSGFVQEQPGTTDTNPNPDNVEEIP